MQNKENNNQSVMIKVFNNGYVISVLLFFAGSIGSFCDGMVASKGLGVAQLAAIGLIYPYTKFMECISIIFSSGSQVVIGRKIGKSKFDEVSAVFYTSLISLGVLGILLLILVNILASPLAGLFGAGSQNDTLEPTVQYLKSLALGAPAYLLTLYMIPLFQLDGKKKLINICTIAMTVVNVLLNIVFLFLHMGISGIGYSTSISYYAALLILSIHFLEKKKEILLHGKFKLACAYLGTIIKEGFPAAFKNITSIVYSIFINNLIAMVGSTQALAAFSAYRMTKFIFLSVTEAIINPVRMIQSMLYEEKNARSLHAIFRHSILMALTLSTVLSLIIWIFGRPLYSLIVSGSILDETVTLMNWVAAVFILNTFVCYYLAYFQAINKKKTVYSISVMLNIVSIPYTYLLAKLFGTTGIWSSMVIQFVIAVIYVFLCAYCMGRKNRRLGDKLLILPQEEESAKVYDYHITSMETAGAALTDFSAACKKEIQEKKKSYYICLAFEELIFNILKYENKMQVQKNNIDVHIIILENNRMLMRIKDCSKERNPFAKYEYKETGDDLENLGIRMLKSFAEDVKYSYVFGMNFMTIKIKI